MKLSLLNWTGIENKAISILEVYHNGVLEYKQYRMKNGNVYKRYV